ncbi:MAG: InlB B-repeat-containing protein [Clostridium sp.]|nr:MAG: InlB B-repeat-containing protein [Clostridium sp.]
MTYKATDNYNLSCTPTRNGFNFDGWYSMREAGSKLTTNTRLINNNDHTIYAHWSAKPITLSNQNFSFTYSSARQSRAMTNATGGSGLYTYTISGNGASNFSISNNNLFVNGGTNTGAYKLTIKATDSISGATTTATFNVTIRNTTTTTYIYIPDPTTRRTTTRPVTPGITTTKKPVTSPPTTKKPVTSPPTTKKPITTTPTRKPITSRQKPSGCTCSGGSGCVGGISCPGSPVSNRSDCCN